MVRHHVERVGLWLGSFLDQKEGESIFLPASALISPIPFFSLSYSALKIHLSSETKAVLEEFGGFELELRGDVEMKVEEEAPSVTIPGGPRGGSPPSSPFSSSHFHSHPNLPFCFPPGQRQSPDLLAPGGAGQ